MEQLQEVVDNLNDEIARRDSQENVDNVMRSLNPSMLSGESETEFRKSFISLHPRFIRGLRAEYPQLTPTDELLCMLIYLHQNNEEIALCLGITRMSVNTARFRLRKKLGLSKSTDLDTFIRSRQE